MGDDINQVHKALSDYTLLEVKSCDDIQFSLDHPLPWRMNMCAVSQLYPTKYFIAVNNEIRIYGLSGVHVFTKQPIMILKPSIDPGFQINTIKVGPMMLTSVHLDKPTEILAAVGDNGEIFAWNTQQLFSTTKSTQENDRKRPFLRKVNMELTGNETSDGVSTWGIALHVYGLLAVSANNHRITIYNLLEKKKEPWMERVHNYLGDRRQVDLAGHVHNIPCIDFDSTGRYLASGSIDMTCRVWDLSTLQQISKRSMTRTLDGDTWVWGVKFISPGNFKHAKCDNISLSNTICRKIENGRSASNSDIHLVHSAPYPIYQLDMSRMFSRLNTEEYSDDEDDYDIGAALGRLNQRAIDMNDGNDDGSEPPADIARLISLSNFLSRHLRQQQPQTEADDVLLDNDGTDLLGFELQGALLDPSPDDHLLHQYDEDENDPTMFDDGNADIGGRIWVDDDTDLQGTGWADSDYDDANNELYDTYNDDQEGQHQGWSDFEDEADRGFVGAIDDDLDALFEIPTPDQQRLEDEEDAHLLDWEDRYMGAGDDLESMGSMGQSDGDIYEHEEQARHDHSGWTDNLSDLNDGTSQPVDDPWGTPQMNQRENYEDLMLEEASWMEDRNMFPWHWTGVRSSNEQDQNDSNIGEEETSQQSNATSDQHQNSVPAWTTRDDDTKTKPTACEAIKSSNPTILVPPTTIYRGTSGNSSNTKIPCIFATEASDDTNQSNLNENDRLQDYLIMTTKKDAYLLKISYEASSSSSPWPVSTMNDVRGGHSMTIIQRERHVVSHADSRTEESLNLMERLCFVEWIPELELCVMASQKGCVALTRILQVQLNTGSKSAQTCLFNHEKYLPLHGLQNSVLYGMTVHRLPFADHSRGFSFPVYQLLLLYLDGTMRSYLISKTQPQLSSSCHTLSDLYYFL